MLNTVFSMLHSAVVLLFEVYLSVAFAGICMNRKNILLSLALCAFSGILQIIAYSAFSDELVWKPYPIIAHLPLAVLLMIVYRKRAATTLAAIFTAYLCCQPSKWSGILMFSLTESSIAEYSVRIVVLAAVAVVTLKFIAPYLAEIFTRDTRSSCIFGIIPAVYYVFDYVMVIYTGFWLENNRIVAEFLPFFCVSFLCFFALFTTESMNTKRTPSVKSRSFASPLSSRQKRWRLSGAANM